MILKPQEKQNYCVCSIIQYILKNQGIKLNQKEIAEKLSPSENGFFVHDQRIFDLFENFGLDYNFYPHNQTPFNEPDMLLGEMSKGNGFIGFNNHTYLVYGFKDPIIHVIDPKDNKRKEIDLGILRKLMANKENGFFGLIKKLD